MKSVLARSKQWLLFLLIALPATAVLAQQGAAEPRLILKGYDPVAYFTVGRPVQGAAQHQYDWDGARYYFSSAANREKFAADPERYAPQFGGYCTGSLSRGVRAETHPDAWIISDGRLYVFGQPKFREIALKDPDWLAVRIPKAAENWKK